VSTGSWEWRHAIGRSRSRGHRLGYWGNHNITLFHLSVKGGCLDDFGKLLPPLPLSVPTSWKGLSDARHKRTSVSHAIRAMRDSGIDGQRRGRGSLKAQPELNGFVTKFWYRRVKGFRAAKSTNCTSIAIAIYHVALTEKNSGTIFESIICLLETASRRSRCGRFVA
jgi:hypothetical protein